MIWNRNSRVPNHGDSSVMASSPAALFALLIAIFLVFGVHEHRMRQSASSHLGMEMPEVSWTPSGGGKTALLDFRGRVVLAHFWANWCHPCLQEMPHLAELESVLGSRPFSLLAFHVDPVKRYQLNSLPLAIYPKNLVLDFDRGILEKMSVLALPTSVLIDKKGIVRRIFDGPQNWLNPMSLKVIEGLLDEGEKTAL